MAVAVAAVEVALASLTMMVAVTISREETVHPILATKSALTVTRWVISHVFALIRTVGVEGAQVVPVDVMVNQAASAEPLSASAAARKDILHVIAQKRILDHNVKLAAEMAVVAVEAATMTVIVRRAEIILAEVVALPFSEEMTVIEVTIDAIIIVKVVKIDAVEIEQAKVTEKVAMVVVVTKIEIEVAIEMETSVSNVALDREIIEAEEELHARKVLVGMDAQGPELASNAARRVTSLVTALSKNSHQDTVEVRVVKTAARKEEAMAVEEAEMMRVAAPGLEEETGMENLAKPKAAPGKMEPQAAGTRQVEGLPAVKATLTGERKDRKFYIEGKGR